MMIDPEPIARSWPISIRFSASLTMTATGSFRNRSAWPRGWPVDVFAAGRSGFSGRLETCPTAAGAGSMWSVGRSGMIIQLYRGSWISARTCGAPALSQLPGIGVVPHGTFGKDGRTGAFLQIQGKGEPGNQWLPGVGRCRTIGRYGCAIECDPEGAV